MGARELLLFGHITFAVVWIGSHVTMQLLSGRARREGPAGVVRFVADSVWLGNGVQGISAALVLILGGALVIVDGFGFGDLWILIGLIGFAVLLVSGVGYMIPQSRRILAAAEAKGPDDAEVRTRIRAVQRVAVGQTVLMLLLVLDMVVKPGL